MTKVIKTESDYAATLAELQKLIQLSPEPGTGSSDRLDLLALLVRDYESRVVSLGRPTPVEAIRFRMDQADLAPKDLIPFIGSRSKVSEVLSGKRQLSLSMIRALSKGLGIPAEVLVAAEPSERNPDVDWKRYPLREMVKRDWLPEAALSDPMGALQKFLAPLRATPSLSVAFRHELSVRSARTIDQYAMDAWIARVLTKARDANVTATDEPLTSRELKEVARISSSPDWPLAIRRELGAMGIALVIEAHLPRTYLDGAALLGVDGVRIVALTLRHDRLDSFWFTLIHELAHIAYHLSQDVVGFIDDLDAGPGSAHAEAEADSIAGEALVPAAAWRRSPASTLRSAEAVEHLAKQLGIHPAIVAGRVRREYASYRVLGAFIGSGEVRKRFAESD